MSQFQDYSVQMDIELSWVQVQNLSLAGQDL